MKKRIDLSRIQERFVRTVKRYMDVNDMNQQELADRVGLERTHVNALINNKRKLTTYYVWQFLRGGIMKTGDVYDGNAESKEEADFWRTASEAENISTLERIGRLREQGVDVDSLLETLLNKPTQ